MSYLRNGLSVNLQAIENCIFSIRSIERNMRPILRTVQPVFLSFSGHGASNVKRNMRSSG
jgi:hypothetical protein